jgi:predicted  nucleic acid-binding Zn-ribbon protein
LLGQLEEHCNYVQKEIKKRDKILEAVVDKIRKIEQSLHTSQQSVKNYVKEIYEELKAIDVRVTYIDATNPSKLFQEFNDSYT